MKVTFAGLIFWQVSPAGISTPVRAVGGTQTDSAQGCRQWTALLRTTSHKVQGKIANDFQMLDPFNLTDTSQEGTQ